MNELTTTPEALKAAIQPFDLPHDATDGILSAYAPHVRDFVDLEREAAEVTAAMPAAARKVRLALTKVRTGSEKVRKALKADLLVRGRAIDGLNAFVLMKLTPVEDRMADIEKAEERAEQKRFEDLVAARMAKIAVLTECPDPYGASVGQMTEAQFADLLTALATIRDQRIAAQAKAEVEAKAKVEAEASERLRLEAERKAQAERLAVLEAERRAEQAKAAEERRIAAQQAAAQQKALADEILRRRAAELAAKKAAEDQAAAQRKAIADQIAQREAAQRRADAIEEAARQAELERVRQEAARVRAEEEKAAALESERKRDEELSRQQPDATKLRDLAARLSLLVLPAMSSSTGEEAMAKVSAEIGRLAARIRATADKIGGPEKGGAK
ncbi:MAG: hypothetical protein MUP86_02910 [Dehalococcoidia bacterium]|nr:hypothetical protein [Dehalococcoidia bacterium]